MKTIPSVYIDANVLKFSSSKQLWLVPKNKKIRNWYGKVTGVIFNAFEHVNPNDYTNKPELKYEASLLPDIANLEINKNLKVVINHETDLESWGLPHLGSETGRFYGAHIEYIDAPIKYGRIIMGPGIALKEAQFKFLDRIENKRFAELQKATGAYQGKKTTNRNQLLDAFHLWCAEHNQCEYFLTLDFKLVRMMERNKKIKLRTKVVRPSTLLEKFG